MKTIKDLATQITSAILRHWLTWLFVALYGLVTLATLRHSAAGFASLEGGNVAWGYLSALAVDVGMALSATGLRKRFDWWLVVGLLVSAAASTFTQLLYAVAHAALLPVAPGAEWMGDAALLVANWRVVVLPALLPALSIVYSFGSHSVGGYDDTEETDYETLSLDNADLVREVDGYKRKVADKEKELARMTRSIEAWNLLNKGQRARLIRECTGNGDGPAPSVADTASALEASRSTVQRAWGEVK